MPNASDIDILKLVLFFLVIAFFVICLIFSDKKNSKLQARIKEKDREIEQLSLVLNEKISKVAIDLGNIAEVLQEKRDELEAILRSMRRNLPKGEEE
jgi:Tfp pilus assembly protein PilO